MRAHDRPLFQPICRSLFYSLPFTIPLALLRTLSLSLSPPNQLDEASAEPLASRFDRRSVDRSLSNASLLSEFNLARALKLFSKKKQKQNNKYKEKILQIYQALVRAVYIVYTPCVTSWRCRAINICEIFIQFFESTQFSVRKCLKYTIIQRSLGKIKGINMVYIIYIQNERKL